jgi:histidinol-phosphatase (PHP family)
MLHAAEAAGLEEVGISDHLTLHPEGKIFKWAMPPERLDEYVETVKQAARQVKIPVRLGIEADFFPQTAAQTKQFLDRQPLDFIIGSVHFAAGFLVDANRKNWAELTDEERETKWTEYWRAVKGLAESGIFDIVGHLDVPKRFGFKQSAAVPQAAREALDAIARAGMALEINSSGWYHRIAESYPSLPMLQEARARNIPILLNADAHNPQDIARGLGAAALLAREAGYTEVARYSGRRRVFAKLKP